MYIQISLISSQPCSQSFSCPHSFHFSLFPENIYSISLTITHCDLIVKQICSTAVFSAMHLHMCTDQLRILTFNVKDLLGHSIQLSTWRMWFQWINDDWMLKMSNGLHQSKHGGIDLMSRSENGYIRRWHSDDVHQFTASAWKVKEKT